MLDFPLNPSPVTLAVTAAVFGVIFVNRIIVARKQSLAHIPFLEFDDGDNSTERYVRESRALVHLGYEKYTKHGLPFRMRNPVDPDHPQVILPWKYLDEVKNAPQNRLSFPLYSKQAFLLDYNNGPQQTDAAAHIVRANLNKHLASLLAGMEEECGLALKKQLPECKEWTPIQPYMAIAYTIARVSSRVLAGTEISRNDEWISMAIQITLVAHQAAQEIRKKYPRHWRWLARWFHPGSKLVLANRRRAAEIFTPVFQKRAAYEDTESGDPDGIQWLLAAAAGKKRKMVQELADEQLFLGITSIHSSTASTLSIIYDLLDRPDIMEEIVEEIEEVQDQLENGKWTKNALSQLEKLDSFMKESQRFNPMGLVTVQRSAVKPYTFKDGFHLPENTQCSFPNYELNHDPDAYPDPEIFDPWRFLKLRKEGDPNKYHFAFVSEQSINFGAGTHACPGRFFASHELKLILIYVLTNYDIKWPDGKCRPPNMVHDFSNIPSPMADLLFREKKCE